MKILATSTDISADDASIALRSVLAPKKAKTTTDSTTTEEEEEELVNDEETTRNIMNSAIDMTDNIMKRWESGEAEFEMGDLSSMLEATFAINDEYAAITKHNAKNFEAGTTTTDETTTTDATTKDATTTDAATTTVAKVSDYEKEKGK